jgi:subtilisin-like proprotein convertase family protein
VRQLSSASTHAVGGTSQEFCNDAAVAAPGAGTEGPASPYPSTIEVTGAGAFTGRVSAQLLGVTHTALRDLDVMLVSPTGENLVLLSDVGGSVPNPITLTFSDFASSQVPDVAPPTGTYRPSNVNSFGVVDVLPAPAPAPSTVTTLATFNNKNPNGTWSLFVNDDRGSEAGTIGGGWCLDITSDEIEFEETATAVTSTPNPSPVGADVTFTATVTSDGDPVTAGTVSFYNWDAPLAVDVPVDDQGRATFTTNTLTETGHFINASYSGATGFFPSSGGVDHRVAQFAGGMWCNNATISVPGSGPDGRANSYPSAIEVDGASFSTTQVTVQLGSVIHNFTKDLDILLVSPTGESIVLMSDVGGFRVPATVTFADGAPAVPEFNALESMTYSPTDAELGDAWPEPAPTSSGATRLDTFKGKNPNGVWSLYVHDDHPGFSGGSIGGGWCLTIASTEIPATVTALTSSANPSSAGEDVSFTARVTTGDEPVTDGTVTLVDGTTGGVLATDLDLDTDGEATVVVDSLSVGDHEMTASYSGTTEFGPSDDTLTQRVMVGTATVLASTPSPSRLGQPVLFTATVESADGNPLTDGTVTFRLGTQVVGTVDVDDGRATLTTSDLVPGVHTITASYSGTAVFVGSSSAPLLHLVDAHGPEARPTPTPPPNAAGWHNQDVAVSWNWRDVDSGIDPIRCRDHSSTKGQGAITVTATCADRAGNQSTASYTVNVDSVAPTVTFSSPSPRTYWQGTSVGADFACRDQRSAVVACTGPVAPGAPIDTATLGVHNFTVAARDRAGNRRTATVSYTVVPLPTCRGQRATIVGTAGNDVLVGTPGPDVIVTGAGRDWVRARRGDDTICTGALRDVVSAGPGDDTIDSGSGRDSVHGGTGEDTLAGGSHADILVGGNGDDTLRGMAGPDNLVGRAGADDITGAAGTDVCRGGSGRDHADACEFIIGIP